MITTAIVLALVTVLIDNFAGGIKEPWRKIIYVGIIILLIVGIVMLIVPGIIPLRFGVY